MVNKLKNLVHLLTERGIDGHWKIKKDEIFNILDLDIRQVYQDIHRSKTPLLNFHKELYKDKDSGTLISLLETLGYFQAERLFVQKGLHLGYDDIITLQEDFLKEIQTATEIHTMDFYTFLNMYDHSKNFHLAYPLYIEEFFPLAYLKKQTLDSFLIGKPNYKTNPGRTRIEEMLDELVKRRILDYYNLFSPVLKQLREFILTQREAPEIRPRERIGEDKGRETLTTDPLMKYRTLLNLPRQFDLADLKQAYKKMMREYHPDVNPRGLEMSKRINEAYGVLLESKKRSN
ncbi:J domain-containing protein [Spirochaeta cellobiosiphila]|uniref:J domain-containing protein n=1 Tax=Spirochaeta cellobiosiphila TaxID=504483 RepID=UPI000428C62C|nr:DnaJ domain-containing protein [Spirochaeta cellobiosiphila]